MTRARTLLVWSVACLAVHVSFCSAASLYVSPTGSDASIGDSSHPWLTLQHAANVVNAGDTVNVLAGSYTGFYESRSGTASSPITFLAQPGVMITANETHFNRDGITAYGGSYIIIDGFTVTGRTRAGISSQNNTNVTIRNCNTDQNGTWGIFTGFSNNFTAENNIASRSVTQHGIYVSNTCVNPIVRGNTLWGNAGCGLHMNGDVSMGGAGIITGALIENNIIYNNGSPGGGAGINQDGVQNSIIRNNLLYNNFAGGFTGYMGDSSAGPKNDIWENNTVIMPSNGRWAMNLSSLGTGNVVKNNIFYQASNSKGSIEADAVYGAGSLTSDYNIVVDRFTDNGDNGNINLASWRSATGQDAHSILVNSSTIASLFVSLATNNYHLVAGSLAVDAGANVAPTVTLDLDGNPRPSGAAYDIGAYEYQFPVILGGDANGDRKVSFADYLILEQNFGKTGATWAMGDFNNDAKVSFADYLILEQNFGKTVPEPASLCLLLCGGLLALRRKS